MKQTDLKPTRIGLTIELLKVSAGVDFFDEHFYFASATRESLLIIIAAYSAVAALLIFDLTITFPFINMTLLMVWWGRSVRLEICDSILGKKSSGADGALYLRRRALQVAGGI